MYRDPSLPHKERVADLVSRMTLGEKISQMIYDAPAIERLGIPAYNWWNECLRGVGRAGLATVFPQAINRGRPQQGLLQQCTDQIRCPPQPLVQIPGFTIFA